MKKTLTLLAILTIWISQSQISQGNSLINFHVGFGLTTQASSSNMSFGGMKSTTETKVPPLGFSYEYAVQDNITVGAFASYSSQQYILSYNDPFGSGDDMEITTDYTYTFFGGLANYHFDFIDNENFDIYAGIKLGYLSFASETNTSGESSFPNAVSTADMSGIIYGGQLGARYFFSDNLAAHLMLGYGVSYISAGLTYKIGY